MSFSFDWILAGAVFVLANFYLGAQLVRLFWPLRALRLTQKMRREAVDAASWLALATDEFRVRSAVPVKRVIMLIQAGNLTEKDELRCRSLWRRGWIYTVLTLGLFYLQPVLFGTSFDALSLTLVLCQALCAYAQALLVKSLADLRRIRVEKFLDAERQPAEEPAEVKSGTTGKEDSEHVDQDLGR